MPIQAVEWRQFLDTKSWLDSPDMVGACCKGKAKVLTVLSAFAG